MLSKMSNTLCQAAGSSKVTRLTTKRWTKPNKTQKGCKGGKRPIVHNFVTGWGGSVLSLSPPLSPFFHLISQAQGLPLTEQSMLVRQPSSGEEEDC